MNKQKKQWLAFLLGGMLLGFVSVAFVWHRNKRLIPYAYDSATTALHQSLIGNWSYTAQAKTAGVQAQFGKDGQNAKLRISREKSAIEFHLPLAESRLTASQDTLHFSNEQNNQEIRYQILPNGVKEEIVLHQKPATNIVTSQVFLKNLAGKVDSQSPRFYDKNNQYQFHFTAPFVIDAKGVRTDQVTYAFVPITDDTDPSNTNFTNVTLATQLEPNKTYILAVIIDATWLESSDRAYPLTIDPTVVHEDTPTVDVSTHDNMRVGTLTPSVRFSATDPGSGDLVYQIQWATDSSMAGSTTVSSDVGSGFSNLDTPADTSPFTSGESIQFTFPSLTNSTTYYYRIQSKVSGGSYDAWTSIRSFSVNTAQVDNTWYQTHSDQFSTNTYGSDIRIDTTNNLVYTRDTNVYTPIQVTNSGGTQTNYDVLLSLNTAALITAGRLQADCDDLRFYNDEYFTTGYNYWIESGCNTTNTQIWVRIPSLPTGVTTIYTGYLNPGASAGSQSWTGNFILPKTTTCPAGSTRFSTLDGYYVRGNSTYGGNASGAHTHSFSGTTSTNGIHNNLWDTDASQYTAPASHSHTYSGTATSAQNTPAYVDTIFCSYAQLPATISTTDVILYSSLPANWTRNTTFDNRFLRGAAAYTTGGGGHVHPMSGTTSQHAMDTVGWVGTATCTWGSFQRWHTHTISGVNTNATDSLPPYYTMIFASPNSAAVLPTAAVVPLNTATMPPYGWTRFSALDTRFPYGSATAGTTGGQTTHTHTYSKNTSDSGSSPNCLDWQSGGSIQPGQHTHTVTGTTTAGSSIPTYFDLIFGQKKTDSTTKSYLPEVNTVTDTITSTAININNLSANPKWNQVTFNDVETYGDVKVQVAYDNGGTIVPIPDGILAGNTAGFDTSPINISGLSATTYSTIYLKATIVSDGLSNQSAQLLDWEVDTIANPSPPSGLLVEGLNNPTITNFTPDFSAIYEDFEVNDQASAYQIQVSTNPIFTALVWDTTKTTLSPALNRGARMTDVAYAGTTLPQGTLYYWRIRFWDSHDLIGDWSTTGDTFYVMDLAGPTNCVGVYSGAENEVTLAWEDQDTQEDNMVVEKLTEPGAFGALITLDADSTGHVDAAVATNTVYQYRIRTVKDSIVSPWCVTARISSSIGTFMVN